MAEQSKVQQLILELEKLKNPSTLVESDTSKTGLAKNEPTSVSVKAQIHDFIFDPWSCCMSATNLYIRSMKTLKKKEPQEIAMPNIPSSKGSSRQKASNKRYQLSSPVKAGIHWTMDGLNSFGLTGLIQN